MNEPELKSILVTTFLFITLLGCVFLYRLKSPDAIAPDNTDHWSASIMDKDYSGDAFDVGAKLFYDMVYKCLSEGTEPEIPPLYAI